MKTKIILTIIGLLILVVLVCSFVFFNADKTGKENFSSLQNQQIIFADENHIYRSSFDGENRESEELIIDSVDGFKPIISPNGNYVAYFENTSTDFCLQLCLESLKDEEYKVCFFRERGDCFNYEYVPDIQWSPTGRYLSWSKFYDERLAPTYLIDVTKENSPIYKFEDCLHYSWLTNSDIITCTGLSKNTVIDIEKYIQSGGLEGVDNLFKSTTKNLKSVNDRIIRLPPPDRAIISEEGKKLLYQTYSPGGSDEFTIIDYDKGEYLTIEWVYFFDFRLSPDGNFLIFESSRDILNNEYDEFGGKLKNVKDFTESDEIPNVLDITNINKVKAYRLHYFDDLNENYIFPNSWIPQLYNKNDLEFNLMEVGEVVILE